MSMETLIKGGINMANIKGKKKETIPVSETTEIIKTVDETVPSMIKEGIVKCQNLNVRKAPSMSATILQIISIGTKVEILDDVNDLWYKIRVSDIEKGYCMKEFINIDK